MSTAKVRPHINSKRATTASNKQRLYWAIARIIIGVASTAFFAYFLVIECQSAYNVNGVLNTVQVDVLVIEWLNANSEVLEKAQYLARNVTLLPPNPYSDQPTTPINLTYDSLNVMQERSFTLLRSLSQSLDIENMLKDNESVQMTLYINQAVEINKNSLIKQENFSWEWYFTIFDFWHNFRFYLMNIVSRNINYQRQGIAMYSVTLTAMLYYRENLACLRDAMLRYYVTPSEVNQEKVALYEKSTMIYKREVEQKMPDSLFTMYMEARSLSIWKECDEFVQYYLSQYHSRDFNSTFNETEWVSCSFTLLHAQKQIRTVLAQKLKKEMEIYLNEIVVSVILACVGIVLELLSAGTLIHQAVPVLLLYMNMKSTTQTVRSGQVSSVDLSPRV